MSDCCPLGYLFYFKCYETLPNSKICLNEVQTFEQSPSCQKYHDIQLSDNENVNSLCQTCHRSLLSVKAKLYNHRLNYDKTVSSLRKTHGRISKKRLPFDELPVAEPKRVSIQPDASTRPPGGSLLPSSLKIMLCSPQIPENFVSAP